MSNDYSDFEPRYDGDLETKVLFAEAWLRNPHNAFEAALTVTNGDPSKALRMASVWIYDDQVKQLKQELVAKFGDEHFLPSKTEMLHDILHRAKKTPMDDNYAKLMKLAADMRGMLQDKSSINISTNVTNNKVMIVPTFVDSSGKALDDNTWEQRLMEQQARLVQQ